MIKKIVCIAWFFIILLSSCTARQAGPANNTAAVTADKPDMPSPSVPHYDVYEEGPSDEANRFNIVMAEDPISAAMLLDQNLITNTHDANVIFNKYIEIWQDELSFSIENLKKYLTEEECLKLDEAQAAWETSWKSEREFDHSLISNHHIFLGTQYYVMQSLLYVIDQHHDRAIHIKYMTQLVETQGQSPVPEEERLWDKFHDFDENR